LKLKTEAIDYEALIPQLFQCYSTSTTRTYGLARIAKTTLATSLGTYASRSTLVKGESFLTWRILFRDQCVIGLCVVCVAARKDGGVGGAPKKRKRKKQEPSRLRKEATPTIEAVGR